MKLLKEDAPVLYAGDYEAHVAFQRSFSLRPLGDAGRSQTRRESLPYSAYYRYSIGDDGLVTKTGQESGEGIGLAGSDAMPYGEFPPFPLADLMGFLEGYTPAASPIHTSGNLVSILLILIPALPSLFRGGRRERKGGSPLVFNDKRIAA
jgi:hypothetical protein